MQVYLAQINTTPGDFEGNFEKINGVLQSPQLNNVDLVVFPELTVCGYLCRDLLYEEGFIDNNLQFLGFIAGACAGLKATVVVGYADKNYKECGKPFRNMAAVIRNGMVVATYQKQLLPFYDVFDEPRYFEPGTDLCKIAVAGKMCGITICEDLWNDKGQDDYNYSNNPVRRYIDNGCDVIINLSSSPYYRGKITQRANMAQEISRECTLIYCNQIGGQDELVFDGNSFVANNGKTISYRHSSVIDTMSYAEADECNRLWYNSGKIEELIEVLKIGLHDYVTKTGNTQVVVNSSGGIDSAVVIALAASVFGGENVHCIMMPSVYSSEGSVKDAKALHEKFGCVEYEVKIDHSPFLKMLRDTYGKETYGVAEENLQARMRGMLGAMFLSNGFGPLPLTTGNKTELALGYCTLYGDMSGGFNPIGDLYKETVKHVGMVLGVPNEILNKAPSAELAPDQTDEDSLMPYKVLDKIVKLYIEYHISDFETFKYFIHSSKCPSLADSVEKEEYDKMIRLIRKNEFKRRQAAPCIKVSKIAFGMGRRMPLVSKFKGTNA